MKKAFCCASFKESIDNAGHRGFAVIPVKNPFQGEEFAYFLQSRNADKDDTELRYLTIMDMGILYCPWCGTKLTEVTKLYKDKIAEIAEKNKGLIKV